MKKETRQKIIQIKERCEKANCNSSSASQKHWNCNECGINREYKKFVGISLDEETKLTNED